MQYYRLRIRNKVDDADLLVISSVPGDANPYLTEPPSGDGQSIDPITGAATTGSYTFRCADAELSDGSRVITAQLADVYARQQLLSLRAYGETSADGATWTTLVPGYVMAVRLISAIEYEIAIGETRRREASKEVFRNASGTFANVSAVIGGPVLEDFAGLLTNNGGWTFKINTIETAPNYFKLSLQTNGGFDPRKSPTTKFSTISDAIFKYTNDWVRPFFQPATTWLADDIQGNFPQLRVRLVPLTGPSPGPDIFLIPLSTPETLAYRWAGVIADNIITNGTGLLYLPAEDEDGAAFSPALNDEFEVWVYALPISEQNPLHIYAHPVDLWKNLRLAAGYVAGTDYDDTNLAALKADIDSFMGGSVRLALRITGPVKLVDFDRSVIYGPFRLSTRVVDGLVQLFSVRVQGTAAPTDIITIDELRSDEGTVFDIDEDSVITAVTLKQLRLIPWTTEEAAQPDIDSLIARAWPVDTIENSDDDIPPGLADSGREVVIGNIPGTIVLHNADASLIVPVPFEQYLATIGDEMFDLFGRGAAKGELACLPVVTAQVGDQILVDLVHRPNAVVGQSPVSQRGGERRVLILQRTEETEGPRLTVMDAVVDGSEPVGAGGGTEEATDPTVVTPDAPIAFAAGAGRASADWTDAYPQWSTLIQWEAHPPGETTFTSVYGGEHLLSPSVFSHVQTGISTGWVARCRIRLTDDTDVSAFSSYSNEVTITYTIPAVPTDIPTGLVATSTVTDEAHGAWTNTNAVLQIRIQWQASTEVADPVTWLNVAGGNRLLVATTATDDQPTGAGTFARFRVAYVNAAGVAGPFADWSDYTAITP